MTKNNDRDYKSLAEIAESVDRHNLELVFGQFLDDFARADDKLSLIEEEPRWRQDPGRWRYDFAATAHKLAHDHGLEVPRWALSDAYISDTPYFAFDTENPKFQAYLRKTTLREFQWHNLYLGENILRRA